MTTSPSSPIETDPDVRDRIGETVMTSMICTHDFESTVCETCWESTQRIGKALVEALPVLRLNYAATREASLLRLAQHLASESMPRRCELATFEGAHAGQCERLTAGLRWENGFADYVCAEHADRATRRGAIIVEPNRHDGTAS